jgi:GMP synthase (glutamine-hydrolysing)
MIAIIDFGSQSTHLISRRLREISIESDIFEPEDFVDRIQGKTIDGIILSGGPQSVHDDGSPAVSNRIFSQGIPVLGICYGEQYMSLKLGGEVITADKQEMGPAQLRITRSSPLFALPDDEQIPSESTVWMSHTDIVTRLPDGFHIIAETDHSPNAAIANEEKQMYGVQFHPELVHTQFGLQILWNFAEICGLKPKHKPIDKQFVDSIITDIKESVGSNKVIGAMSGGVDSSIANLLVHEAIGDNLTPIYIDSGLMREGETDLLSSVFEKHYQMKVEIVHAKDEFLKNLEGVTDPEEKRKVIGKTFIDVLNREAEKRDAISLVQGTIWPDVIESAGSKHSNVIKSHHNVGGLPADMKLTLLEPLRNLYKDEVRQIGKILGLPEEITNRKPFPGPGLAVRVVGEVTDEKLSVLRKADHILQEEIENWDGHEKVWQTFAIYTGIKTTGVGGDFRSYGDLIAIRSIESHDAMSGNFTRIPYDILDTISTRMTNEVQSVNRVVYDVTNKPPGTIEWE